jgi:hypothetical protein
MTIISSLEPDRDRTLELIVRSPASASERFRFELREFAAQAAASAMATEMYSTKCGKGVRSEGQT